MSDKDLPRLYLSSADLDEMTQAHASGVLHVYETLSDGTGILITAWTGEEEEGS